MIFLCWVASYFLNVGVACSSLPSFFAHAQISQKEPATLARPVDVAYRVEVLLAKKANAHVRT